MSPRTTRLLLAVGAAACLACRASDRPAQDGPRTVSERVGDTLVVRTIGAPDTATLRLVPELRIGELEGADEYSFGRVTALAPAAAGGVYVWDALVKSIRHYDSAGRFVRQVGHRGRGPGEYENVAGMVLVDGMLAFWDRTNQHVSVYDSAGALVRRWQPASPRAPMGELYAGTEGSVYLRHVLTLAPPGDREGLQTGYVGSDVRGTPTGDTLPQLMFDEDDHVSLRAEGQRGVMITTVPHSPVPLGVLSPRGYLVQGRGDRYSLLLARRAARPLRIEREVAAVPVGDEERADEEARITAEMRALDAGWRWSGAPIPAHKPFFRQLRFDADGRLWVERARASTRIPDAEIAAAPARSNTFGALPPRRWREPVYYDLFEPDGRYLGTLVPPDRGTLLHMRGDTVWGVVRDSLDVPYVTRWRIEPSIGVARVGDGDER